VFGGTDASYNPIIVQAQGIVAIARPFKGSDGRGPIVLDNYECHLRCESRRVTTLPL
jgi:hypothetical protein